VVARTSGGTPGAGALRDAVHDLEARVRRLGEVERFVLAKLLGRETLARNPRAEYEAGLALGERVADQVASFGGSWAFIFLFLSWLPWRSGWPSMPRARSPSSPTRSSC
jgi:hypothetical protein